MWRLSISSVVISFTNGWPALEWRQCPCTAMKCWTTTFRVARPAMDCSSVRFPCSLFFGRDFNTISRFFLLPFASKLTSKKVENQFLTQHTLSESSSQRTVEVFVVSHQKTGRVDSIEDIDFDPIRAQVGSIGDDEKTKFGNLKDCHLTAVLELNTFGWSGGRHTGQTVFRFHDWENGWKKETGKAGRKKQRI